MWCMELKIGTSEKHTKFCQNLRGSLQFFGDWAWNDPYPFMELEGIVNMDTKLPHQQTPTGYPGRVI